LAATAQTLPAVYFNDVSPSDLLGADTLVTFQVNMTNAQAIAWNSNPAFVFNPATDGVYLNGAFIPWWSWSIDFAPAEYKMTNAPGIQVYTITIPFLKGSPVGISYKYGINGGDNEAARDANHFRYIRSVGTYMMPLDTFGVQYVEPAVGDLTIGNPVNGNILLTWMGQPGVHLQSSSPGLDSWVDLMATDGQSSTNYPIGPSNTFFRLVKP
jgi:hypothetical protein